jgi:hypothetical protein
MSDMRQLADRAVVGVAGPDAADFLQGLVTQSVAAAAANRLAFGALLTPQGKALFDFIFETRGGEFLFDCAAAAADAFVKRISFYRLRARVDIGRRDHLGVFWAPDGADGMADPRLSALGPRRIGPLAPGGSHADAGAYDARRIALGVPEFGKDYGADEVFPLDVNLDALRGVDYRKGCFVGQEVTSRMKRKGEVRKRTLIARFDGPPPSKGTEIVAGASKIGEILSGAEAAALALVRLDRLEAARAAGAAIAADGVTLRLEVPAYLEHD